MHLFFIVLLLLLHTHAMNNVCNNKRKRQVVHASIFITITREDTLFFCYGTHIYFKKGNVFALTSIMLFVWCIASFFSFKRTFLSYCCFLLLLFDHLILLCMCTKFWMSYEKTCCSCTYSVAMLLQLKIKSGPL